MNLISNEINYVLINIFKGPLIPLRDSHMLHLRQATLLHKQAMDHLSLLAMGRHQGATHHQDSRSLDMAITPMHQQRLLYHSRLLPLCSRFTQSLCVAHAPTAVLRLSQQHILRAEPSHGSCVSLSVYLGMYLYVWLATECGG